MFDYNPHSDKCHACQVTDWVYNPETSDKQRSWETVSQADRNRWSMWGCTCTPEQAQAAQDYMDMVTR